MELPPDSTPPEGKEPVSQGDKDAVLRRRILIGIAGVVAFVFLMGIRGPIAIAPKTKEAEWDDFAQLLGEEAEILARNQGVSPAGSGLSGEEKRLASAKRAAQDQQRKQVSGTSRAAAESTSSTGNANSRKTSTPRKPQVKSPLRVCYEHDCQLQAQKGFLSFNRITSENLDGWFSRDAYLLAIRSAQSSSKKLDLDKLVTKVKADLIEYARLKNRSSKNQETLDELRTQILNDWLSLPVIPPRMSLRKSGKGVMGTLSSRDEVMEIVSINDDESILVKNTAVMPYSKEKPDVNLYQITGIKTSKLVAGERFKPNAVFQCAGTRSYKPSGGKTSTVKKFDAVDFAALAKQAIQNSSRLK